MKNNYKNNQASKCPKILKLVRQKIGKKTKERLIIDEINAKIEDKDEKSEYEKFIYKNKL